MSVVSVFRGIIRGTTANWETSCWTFLRENRESIHSSKCVNSFGKEEEDELVKSGVKGNTSPRWPNRWQ